MPAAAPDTTTTGPLPSSPHSHQDSEASLSEGSHDESVYVDLSDIRKDVQCPICLGIIRKTRTVMECLHRFCRECIDKSMRLGNNECPVCRTHCASRRSLRDDLNFDAVIAVLYPDLDCYEEEELALREEDKHRNIQLQASIAETSVRQSDAIARRCTTAKATAAAIVRKAHTKLHNIQHRNRGRTQGEDHRYSYSHEDEDEDDDLLDLEYEQAGPMEDTPSKNGFRTRKRKTPNCVLDTSRTQASSDDDHAEQDKALHLTHEKVDVDTRRQTSTAAEGNRMRLVTWARAGARSLMRYGSLSNSNSMHVQSTRATVLLESILSRQEIDAEFDVHFTLQPSDHSEGEEKLPNLKKPNLCCPARVSVHHICKFLMNRLCPAPTRELELLVGSPSGQPESNVEGKFSQQSKGRMWTSGAESSKAIEILHPHVTLGQIHKDFWNYCGNLVLVYRCKA